MTLSVFISYRRELSEERAAEIRDSLSDDLDVFFDVESVELLEDFNNRILEGIRASDVLLVVVPPGWSEEFEKRNETFDYVLAEIEQALFENIDVLPVFVDDAQKQGFGQLPDSIHAIATIQAETWTGPETGRDLARKLTRKLAGVHSTTLAPVGPRSKSSRRIEASRRGMLIEGDGKPEDLSRTDLQEARFVGDWVDARFEGSLIGGANFSETHSLKRANFGRCRGGPGHRARSKIGWFATLGSWFAAATAIVFTFGAVVGLQKLATNVTAYVNGEPFSDLNSPLPSLLSSDDVTFLVYGTFHAAIGGLLIYAVLSMGMRGENADRSALSLLPPLLIFGVFAYVLGTSNLLGEHCRTDFPCDVERLCGADSVQYLGMASVFVAAALTASWALGALIFLARVLARTHSAGTLHVAATLGALSGLALVTQMRGLSEPVADFEGQLCRTAVLGTLLVSAIIGTRAYRFALVVAEELSGGRWAPVRQWLIAKLIASGTNFRGCDLTRAGFADAELAFCDFRGASLMDADLRAARGLDLALFHPRDALALPQMQNAVSTCQLAAVSNADLSKASLVGLRLDGSFRSVSFDGCSFREADLRKATFESCTFRGAFFDRTLAGDASFADCDFTDARFQNASLVRSRFARCTLERVQVFESCLRRASFSGGTLRYAEFHGGQAVRVLLQGAVDLEMVRIEGGDWTGVTLSDWRSGRSVQTKGVKCFHFVVDGTRIPSEVSLDSIAEKLGAAFNSR